MANKAREIFKKHYRLRHLPGGFEVHHIDMDPENNSPDNLMVMPRILHARYHYLLDALHADNDLTIAFSAGISRGPANRISDPIAAMRAMTDTLVECNRWYDFKLYLDGEVPNIHGFSLEG